MFQSIFNELELEKFLRVIAEKPYRLKQIYEGIFAMHATSIHEIKTLPQGLRDQLDSKFTICTLKVILEQTSPNGKTTKLLVGLCDRKNIEIVIMRHMGKNNKRRNTACLSTQVGCAMGCTFCATGTMGLMRNLTAAEIVEQLYLAEQICHINNIVFMGMGEPLNNYSALISSLKMIKDPKKWGIGSRHITISTCGIIPQIKQLMFDEPQINLAISLHAPNQKLRAQIMPIAKPYPLEQLMFTLEEYFKITKRRIFYEYILLEDINDAPEHARQLGRLLQGKVGHINLIPYNKTNVKTLYQQTAYQQILKFQKIIADYGVPVTIRQTMGEDIAGACGQLVKQ